MYGTNFRTFNACRRLSPKKASVIYTQLDILLLPTLNLVYHTGDMVVYIHIPFSVKKDLHLESWHFLAFQSFTRLSRLCWKYAGTIRLHTRRGEQESIAKRGAVLGVGGGGSSMRVALTRRTSERRELRC